MRTKKITNDKQSVITKRDTMTAVQNSRNTNQIRINNRIQYK